jgi:hypothetical protein
MIAKTEFLKLAELKYEEIQKLEGTPSFYDYEKSFDKIWTELGKTVLEKSISEVPKDRRKKNFK